MPSSSSSAASLSAANVKKWPSISGLSDSPKPGWSTRSVRNCEANRPSEDPKLLQADAPGPPPCSITSGSPPPTSVGSPASW